jgi:DNA-binding transcriptional LysR family regulator
MREGSLSSAARTLGLTQPTAGRQMAALEKALGVTLFTRTPEGLSPTDAGMRLIPLAQAMAAAAEEALRSASGEAAEERGTVRVTASEIIGTEVLPTILATFQTLHPQIAVELALSNRNEDLLRGDADIAIRMVRPTQGVLIARQIGRVDVGLYAHRSYLKGRTKPGKLGDLQQHALIGYDRDQSYVRMIEWMRTNLTREMFAFRSDSDRAQLAAVRAGLGIGASQLGIARKDKNLVPVLHDELIYPMDVWVAMHRDLRSNRRIRLMFDHLVEEMKLYAQSSRHGP